MGFKGWYLFAVADGHGGYGQSVSRFIKNNLPTQIQQNLKDNETENLEQSFKDAFLKTQQSLCKTTIDCVTSGSTAVCCLLTGKYVITSNLGDSRAIICSRKND